MQDLSFSIVDLLVVLTLIASVALAIWRGFIRETLSIFAWAAAAFATLYAGPAAAALLRDRVSTPYLGILLAYAGIFLLVLIPLSFASYRFSESVKSSPIGSVDRSLGAAFGAIRALALLGICYLAFSMIVPVPSQPQWVTRARTLPMIQGASDVLLTLLPASGVHQLATATATPLSVPSSGLPIPKPKPVATARKAGKAYGAGDRRALDKLIEATGSGGNEK